MSYNVQGRTGNSTPTAGGPPPPLCKCGLECSYKVSQSEKNPGKPYYACCRKKSEGQCDTFQWVDAPGAPRKPQQYRSKVYNNQAGQSYPIPPTAPVADNFPSPVPLSRPPPLPSRSEPDNDVGSGLASMEAMMKEQNAMMNTHMGAIGNYLAQISEHMYSIVNLLGAARAAAEDTMETQK